MQSRHMRPRAASRGCERWLAAPALVFAPTTRRRKKKTRRVGASASTGHASSHEQVRAAAAAAASANRLQHVRLHCTCVRLEGGDQMHMCW